MKVLLSTIATICLVPFLAMGSPESVRFSGGSYDGWDMDETASPVFLNGPRVTLNSGQDQFLDGRIYRSRLAPITITDSSGDAIGARRIIAIEFSDPLNLKWDIGELVYPHGGSAGSKAGMATLANDDTRLEIFVTENLDAGQTIVLSGLRVAGVPFCPQYRPGRIRLDVNQDNLWDAVDPYTLSVGMIWSGGPHDGWDRNAIYQPTLLVRRGSLIHLR